MAPVHVLCITLSTLSYIIYFSLHKEQSNLISINQSSNKFVSKWHCMNYVDRKCSRYYDIIEDTVADR